MRSTLRLRGLLSTLSTLAFVLFAQSPSQPSSEALVKKIQDEIAGKLRVRNIVPGVPGGEMLRGSISNPRTYPGTENEFQVYVPKEYNPGHPACLLLKLDGLTSYEAAVLDQLIATKESRTRTARSVSTVRMSSTA